MPTRAELAGRHFGELTPRKDVGRNQHGDRLWLCDCSCGRTRVVSNHMLAGGHADSCGCRPCSECGRRFVPAPHEPRNVKTCSPRCWQQRDARKKREAQDRFRSGQTSPTRRWTAEEDAM